MSYLKKSHEILFKIIREGSFVNIQLNDVDVKDRPVVTKIVYGSLNKYFELNYIIDSLSKDSPKPLIRVLLIQAIYSLNYLSIPAYAIVNESVELVKELKKQQLSGYVNAILNKVVRKEYKLDLKNEEVRYNLPKWYIELIKKEYPTNYEQILTSKGKEEEHVRLSRDFKPEDFEKKISEFEKTETGYFVRVNDAIKDLFNKGLLTFQSLTSTLAVEKIGVVKNKSVLDLCSAPGGKSVYLSEKGAVVTAAELYPHRLKLIESYAKRMRVKLNIVQNDALNYNSDWENRFDIVLLDAPCSGLGVISKRPDIVLKRQVEDIDRLASLQQKMLSTASKYVKAGGLLVYSTCTVLSQENSKQIETFLNENKNFSLAGEPIQYLPDNNGLDGFFISKMIRGK